MVVGVVNMVLGSELPALEDDSRARRQATMGSRVFDTLRQAIVQLQLRPGNPLSEAEIARQLGVSRQPVREAFIKLSEIGLLEIRPQRGTFVRLISIREVETPASSARRSRWPSSARRRRRRLPRTSPRS